MTQILKLDRSDESRELEFELDDQLSFSMEERFQVMFPKFKEILIVNEDRNPFDFIKRNE